VISSIVVVVFLLGINHIKLKFSGDFEKIYEKYEDIRKEIIKSKKEKKSVRNIGGNRKVFVFPLS
jgi:hypothetical protein